MLERTDVNEGRLVQIEAEAVVLTGILSIPDDAKGLVILIARMAGQWFTRWLVVSA